MVSRPTFSPVFLSEMTSSAEPLPCQYPSPSDTVPTVILNRCTGGRAGGAWVVVGGGGGGASVVVGGASVGASVVGSCVGASVVGTSTGGELVSSPSGSAYAGPANSIEQTAAKSTKEPARSRLVRRPVGASMRGCPSDLVSTAGRG